MKSESWNLLERPQGTSSRMCVDYRNLNVASRKDYFSLPFFDQILEEVSGYKYYCFSDVFSRHYPNRDSPKGPRESYFHFVFLRL